MAARWCAPRAAVPSRSGCTVTPDHLRCREGGAGRLPDGRRADRLPADRVRQPARLPVPGLLGGLPGRHLPPDPRRPARRQGRPRGRQRPSPRVRHLHRPLLRPGPRPPGEGRQGRCRAVPGATTPCARTAGRRAAAVRTSADDPQVGQPLCLDCYDYRGAVLWNAHAGELWRRFTNSARRLRPARSASPGRSFGGRLRLSYAKVAEYQARGLVHFHAVIRLDGPDGPTDRPPDWATVALLDDAIRAAAGCGRRFPCRSDGPARPSCRWGDAARRPTDLRRDLDLTGSRDQRVAAYVAKYATKGAESAGHRGPPIRHARRRRRGSTSPSTPGA